jgi:tetratricopeptide (TPR) repeat protein
LGLDNHAELFHTSGMNDAALQHDLVLQLREHLAQRRIGLGLRILEERRDLFALIHPDRPGTTVLLGYLAQWVDVGFSSPSLIETILARYLPESRIHLPLIDYVHLRLAEGLIAMWREEFDAAIGHFAFIGSVEDEVPDNELVAVSHFSRARCLRKSGRYDDALLFTTKARDIAFALGYPKMAAIMRITESWLLFQKGRTAEASRIMEAAATALSDTDDYVARGNIESAYGRIARRQGSYDRAMIHFNQAIEEYRKRDPQHPNIARSLVNAVFVKRLVGVQIQKKLDHETARRKADKPNQARMREAMTGESAPSGGLAQERARIESLRSEAHTQLDQAGAIYRRCDNHRGRGAVHVIRGFLYFDSGELDSAFAEASEAHRAAQEKSDYILMARSRILQCIIESSRFEEQIEDNVDPSVHAQRACDFAREALESARHTENRRLLARAYIWQGLVFANEFFNNVDAARQCCDDATTLLRPEGQDYIWDDLQLLKAQILRKGRLDTVLREWSQGLVGEKSFQQITEEFATIVIPRVWEREARKVSRVAERLSVSPKKVRRVLQAAGVLDKGGNETAKELKLPKSLSPRNTI